MFKNFIEKEERKSIILGSIFLFVFIFLVVMGIVVKRVYNHPEYMMLFHGPAAVFLIIGGLKVTAKFRRLNEANFKNHKGI